MRQKRVVFLALFLLLASVFFAAPGSTVVYITKTGAKYHREGCSSLAKSKIAISLEDSTKRGYGACKLCHPPVLDKQ